MFFENMLPVLKERIIGLNSAMGRLELPKAYCISSMFTTVLVCIQNLSATGLNAAVLVIVLERQLMSLRIPK